jgi:mannose-6-phosphate isomerase-like protein (cupin superfamily)
MGFQVYDHRQDIRNVLVTPEIRARFMRIEVGEISGGTAPGRGHSHDLGHEVFMILQGQAEFEIEGETRVLGPGQMCVARVDETHTVRNVGDEPVIMYLSVTPHIQPTHTMWDAPGDKAPPRFVPSTTYDVPADRDTPSAELADRQLEAVEALSEATRHATAVQREQIEAFKQALEAGDRQTALGARDAIWEALYPLFRQMYALAEAWNALTYRTADADFLADGS